MRAILAVAITATFVLAFWWNHSTLAGTGSNATTSIDLAVTTLNASDMPAQQYP
jgi:hypothetical protein